MIFQAISITSRGPTPLTLRSKSRDSLIDGRAKFVDLTVVEREHKIEDKLVIRTQSVEITVRHVTWPNAAAHREPGLSAIRCSRWLSRF